MITGTIKVWVFSFVLTKKYRLYYTVSMNRNMANEIEKIAGIFASEEDSDVIKNFMLEILTKSEAETLSKRWRILEMLKEGQTQRTIAKELGVSLCKVTRGSQILKNSKSAIAKYL